LRSPDCTLTSILPPRSGLNTRDCESTSYCESGLLANSAQICLQLFTKTRLGLANGANRCGPVNTQCASGYWGRSPKQRWLPPGLCGFQLPCEGEPQRVNIVRSVHKRSAGAKSSLKLVRLTAFLPTIVISKLVNPVTCQWRRTALSKSTRLINPALSCASIRLHRQPTHTIINTHRLS
jgi:hypothetical protein